MGRQVATLMKMMCLTKIYVKLIYTVLKAIFKFKCRCRCPCRDANAEIFQWPFLTYFLITFSFLVQYLFHSNISRWKLLLLLQFKWCNLKRTTETKMFDQWFNLLKWISKEILGCLLFYERTNTFVQNL